ncbi:MAG: hypothetical protein IPJ32_13690 [Sphingobacteriaceae bacterium]|nr:hypothetical protein [Sphingobacteriaceae bacterium]
MLKAYQGLGSCYYQYEDYETTLAYGDSCVQLPGSIKYPKILLLAYANICDAYLALGKFTWPEQPVIQLFGMPFNKKA